MDESKVSGFGGAAGREERNEGGASEGLPPSSGLLWTWDFLVVSHPSRPRALSASVLTGPGPSPGKGIYGIEK